MITNTQGTKVSALIFSDYLEFFKNTFQLYKRYRISNATLILTEPRYRLGSYEHSWSLTKKTLIEPQPDLTSPTLPNLFNFTPFSEMFKYADVENNLRLSLSTGNGSSILINPPVNTDLRLYNWFQQNNKEIKDLLQRETYKDTDILLPHPK
ncbi:unnamed protein product [Lactuca saligna]|uniref:Uncharacterized protein n=1 Tax=Lactuca saligna TaxID=75948 RepID=A0AA36E3Q6_LACSI|nr:unnamed protein product [Lactuca saligna]